MPEAAALALWPAVHIIPHTHAKPIVRPFGLSDFLTLEQPLDHIMQAVPGALLHRPHLVGVAVDDDLEPGGGYHLDRVPRGRSGVKQRDIVYRGVIQRGFRFRLYPTPDQTVALEQMSGVVRFVYNLAWEQRRDWRAQYRAATGKDITVASQCREVTQLRAEHPWIAAAASSALTQALRDLDRAFSSFIRGRSRFPSPRRKGVHDSFRIQGKEVTARPVNKRWGVVRIPNIGWIKYRHTRPLCGELVSATVSRDGLGWHVALVCSIEHVCPPTSALPFVGIDRGVANTLALSTGQMVSTPATTALQLRQARAQRKLARRVRGSARYGRQRALVRRIANKMALVRADWRHKTTTEIARKFGHVAIEALETASMTRSGRGKRSLNRRILEQAWGAFERILAYKLEERGGALVKVNPAYTSQTCSDCGTIDKASRESQASFACRHCGFAAHADTNAAINILRRSTASMRVEGAGCGPDETRTDNHAIAV